MNILCWLIGHKELKLDVLKDGLIRVGDITGVLLKIKCCERCKLLYWEIFKKE